MEYAFLGGAVLLTLVVYWRLHRGAFMWVALLLLALVAGVALPGMIAPAVVGGVAALLLLGKFATGMHGQWLRLVLVAVVACILVALYLLGGR